MSKCSPVPPAEKEKPCSSRWKIMTPELCHYCTLRFLFVESRAVTVVQLQWLLVGHSDSGATVQHPLLSASYPGRLLESDLAHLSCPGIISPRYPPRWQSSPADVFIPVRIFGLFVLILFRQEICLHTSSLVFRLQSLKVSSGTARRKRGPAISERRAEACGAKTPNKPPARSIRRMSPEPRQQTLQSDARGIAAQAQRGATPRPASCGTCQ